MQELPYIPYNRSNKDYAKSMRRHMTVAEQRLWFEVLRHRPLGYKWIRQKMIEGFIADFYCSKLGLVIEVDGAYHLDQMQYDERRTKVIGKRGIEVIRYSNDEIVHSLEYVEKDVIEIMKVKEKNI